MPTYGRTTAGASWLTIEARYSGRRITLASSETALKISAYLRSQGSATNGIKAALYNYADDTLAYESSVLSGFTDTTGGWKDFTFTDTVAAGDYWVVVRADAMPGGANTCEIAYDTVTSDTTLYQWWFVTSGFPTFDADLTGFEMPGGTHDNSIYLETSSGGGGGGGGLAWIRA